MTESFTHLYESEQITNLQADVDTLSLNNSIGRAERVLPPRSSQLSLAANVATAAFFNKISLDQLLNQGSDEFEMPILEAAVSSWRAYLETVRENAVAPVDSSDPVLFAACGMLAKNQIDVRNLLRVGFFRASVDDEIPQMIDADSWSSTCEALVNKAVLLLIRQDGRKDIADASKVISELSQFQKLRSERKDLDNTMSNSASTSIVGLYHLAQATIRTANFLVTGRASTGQEKNTNFEPELRRLLLKAEEFMEASNSPEAILWSRAIGAILWTVFDQSIWRQARGLSQGIDSLIEELAGRDHPIFSLMPSQQQALREHLLDSAQIAVVLQMPTSAGKTLLAEFYILQAMEAYKEKTRVLFVTPTRALCTQTYRTLAADLGPLGITVQQASSAFEEDPFEASLLSDMDTGVIVSTPEKADLFLRAHPEWFQGVKLIVVDEAHLISDKERGVRLELLLANIRREQPTTRFLLLTPFVENALDVAKWLGGSRGASISVRWRPSRILVGLASTKTSEGVRRTHIEWKEPFSSRAAPAELSFNTALRSNATSIDKVVELQSDLCQLGLSLGMFPSSKKYAETAAIRVAERQPNTIAPGSSEFPDELRLAIGLANVEYGDNSTLARCLAHRTAFHHSSLSPELRFLIEDLGRSRHLQFLAATTTLAQGINFPVASVLVHSLNKPNVGRNLGGDLSPTEFWNIAGRAGRVGFVDKGLVIFANEGHRPKWESYVEHLSEPIRSALLSVLSAAMAEGSLKSAYRLFPQIRPFIQYLAHAAATLTTTGALAALEEILEASFANVSATNRSERRALRDLARRYLGEISAKPTGYLKIADTTGFSSFSFDELYAKIPNDKILSSGPSAVLKGGADTLSHLVAMLAWLPELNLALGNGEGQIDANAVARVVSGWMNGNTVSEISTEFNGDDTDRVRKAGAYIFSTVSQTISWGAHAYVRGWALRNTASASEAESSGFMLPAYIQHGVHTPEAAVASLFGVPRLIAEPMADHFRNSFGNLMPENTREFRQFIERGDDKMWEAVVSNSRLSGKVSGTVVRRVWRKMRGLVV
jgi:helicase